MIRTLFILSSIFLLSSNIYAQRKVRAKLSGTKITAEQKLFLDGHREALKNFNDSMARGVVEIPLKIHICKSSDGTQGLSVKEATLAIETINQYFLNGYIRFVPLGDYNYIKDDAMYNFDRSLEKKLCKNTDTENVINLYIVNQIQDGKKYYGAYTYYPIEKKNIDRVFITKEFLNNKVSLARQLAHYLGLYPTHGTHLSEKELVIGKNCMTAGDEICDTPADPKLKGSSVDTRCGFLGKERDKYNKFYHPQTDNIMSNNPRFKCRNHFTQQQLARMSYFARNIRNYLKFPKSGFSKKQLKRLKEDSGVEASIVMQMRASAAGSNRDFNLYTLKDSYAQGDRFRIRVENHQNAYIYILEGDEIRGVHLRYPLTEKNHKVYFSEGKKTIMAPSKSEYYEVDENRGSQKTNYVCILFSQRQIPIGKIYDKLNDEALYEDNLIQRVYKVLGKDLASSENIEYKENIKISGFTTERPIVPVFIEYKQK